MHNSKFRGFEYDNNPMDTNFEVVCYLHLSLILLYALSMNINGYVTFLINTSDTIVGEWNIRAK